MVKWLVYDYPASRSWSSDLIPQLSGSKAYVSQWVSQSYLLKSLSFKQEYCIELFDPIPTFLSTKKWSVYVSYSFKHSNDDCSKCHYYLTRLVAESKQNDSPNKNKHRDQWADPSHLLSNELLLNRRMPYSVIYSLAEFSWTSMWSYTKVINNVFKRDYPRLGLSPLT